jgi:hypothetical protein
MSRIFRLFVVALAVTAIAPAYMMTTGCSSSSAKKKAKGGGAKATAAKSEGQKAGGAGTAAKDKASSKGADYEGVTCDAASEGVAWCDSEGTMIFCAGGEFYALSCAELDGSVCAEDEEANVIDCVAASDT